MLTSPEQIASLRKTLMDLNLLDFDLSKLTILKHGYSDQERSDVHAVTNETISRCLARDNLGECIHITGEMKAITDPSHRDICDAINTQEKNIFKVVYKLPKEHIGSPMKMIEWSLDGWKSPTKNRDWKEELRTIYSIANRSVNLFSFDTTDTIQYSVFGGKYILLQSKHVDGKQDKHAWLLESKILNPLLTNRAKDIISVAENVDEGNYRRFVQNISGVSSKHLLRLLRKNGNLSKTKIMSDEIIVDFSDSIDDMLESLRIMGFIDIKADSAISITSDGLEYIL